MHAHHQSYFHLDVSIAAITKSANIGVHWGLDSSSCKLRENLIGFEVRHEKSFFAIFPNPETLTKQSMYHDVSIKHCLNMDKIPSMAGFLLLQFKS